MILKVLLTFALETEEQFKSLRAKLELASKKGCCLRPYPTSSNLPAIQIQACDDLCKKSLGFC